MKYIITIITIFFFLTGYTQKADYFMKHYSFPGVYADHRILDLTTDSNGLLWIATNKGVLSYDGQEWEFYSTPSAVFSIEVHNNNTIYMGSIGEIGKLDYSDNYRFEYQKVFESDSASDIFFRVKKLDNTVFFSGYNTLTAIDSKGELKADYNNYRALYVKEQKLILRTDQGSFNYMEGSEESDEEIRASFQNKNSEILIKTNGELWVDQKRLSISDVLRQNGINPVDGRFVNDSLMVISTIDKGLVFMDISDQDFYKSINFNSGLPDNEIIDIHVDKQQGLWVAHSFGLTRIIPVFPSYLYSNIPGLRGKLLSANPINDQLWVTTSLGVFYYSQDTAYKTKVYYEEIKPKTQVSTPEPPKPKPEEEKGLLKGLFGKKNDESKESDETSSIKSFFNKVGSKIDDVFVLEAQNDRIRGTKNKDKKYRRIEKKIPQNITYSYKKVPGANGKFQQVIPFKDKLLAFGSSGIYEISKDKSTEVIEEPIRLITKTKTNQILAYNYDLELLLFDLQDNVWVELWRQQTNDFFLSFFTDSDNSIWATGPETLYHIHYSDTSLELVDQFEINNQLLDHAEIIRVGDDYHLVNSNGWYIKRKNSSVFESNTEINTQYGKPEDYVRDNQGNIWFNNGKSWFLFDSEGKITAFEYFSLFQDIRTINREEGTDLFWIVTNNDRLYYYQGDTDLDLSLVRDLFVKNVKSEKRSFRSKSKFNLSHDENNLFVNLSLPDYSGLLNPSFRYKLEGLNNEWSDWTNNSNIDFSYLPPGDYDLKVRSRDNFGREKEYSVLSFKVKTPYWEQPWFYALQISFFAALVFFSTRLNRTKKSNQLLVEGLTVFTIILIIEFLQSVIASYFEFESSPVVSFGIDATVALCIFPLERFLRTFIKEGKAKVSVPPISMKNVKSDQG